MDSDTIIRQRAGAQSLRRIVSGTKVLFDTFSFKKNYDTGFRQIGMADAENMCYTDTVGFYVKGGQRLCQFGFSL